MTAITASYVGLNQGEELSDADRAQSRKVKIVVVTTATTTQQGSTVSFTLGNYGIKRLLGIDGWFHTSENNILVKENPTTAVASDVLTITIAASNGNGARSYMIVGQEK